MARNLKIGERVTQNAFTTSVEYYPDETKKSYWPKEVKFGTVVRVYRDYWTIVIVKPDPPGFGEFSIQTSKLYRVKPDAKP